MYLKLHWANFALWCGRWKTSHLIHSAWRRVQLRTFLFGKRLITSAKDYCRRLCVCQQDYTKTTEQISTKLGSVLGQTHPPSINFGKDVDKGMDPGNLFTFLKHCKGIFFFPTVALISQGSRWKSLAYLNGWYLWARFKFKEFDIWWGLIKFKGTVGPLWKHVIHWVPFCFVLSKPISYARSVLLSWHRGYSNGFGLQPTYQFVNNKVNFRHGNCYCFTFLQLSLYKSEMLAVIQHYGFVFIFFLPQTKMNIWKVQIRHSEITSHQNEATALTFMFILSVVTI